MNFIIVGLGGIGSVLSEFLCMYLAHDEKYKESNIVLVDGDEYELKNKQRQIFECLGPKAEVKAAELQQKYNLLKLSSYNNYINNDNVEKLIKERSIVFLCLDNHASRKIISDYCERLKNIILISGGNEITDGSVQLYIRKGGKDVTPSLTKYHDEIKYPSDKSPEEMSCEELSKSAPQLFFTNANVAIMMCNVFYSFIELNNNNKPSNVYLDIIKCNAHAVVRNV